MFACSSLDGEALAVEEDACAGADFSEPGHLVAAPQGRCGAATDHRRRQIRGAQGVVERLEQSAECQQVVALAFHGGADLARIEHEACVLQPVRVSYNPGERHRLLGSLQSDPVEADVDLHQDAHPTIGGVGRPLNESEHVGRIEPDHETNGVGQGHQPVEFVASHDRIRDQDVVGDAGHDLGLAGRCHGEASCPGVELEPREAGTLMRLDVGPPRDPVLVAVGHHPLDVVADPLQVDDADRGLAAGEHLSEDLLREDVVEGFQEHRVALEDGPVLEEPDDAIPIQQEAGRETDGSEDVG